MKKYLYIIVCATLILISTTVVKASNEVYYTNKRNIQMTEQEYNNLLNLGFSDKDIARMDQEEFDLNKNLEGEILDEQVKYIRTTTYMQNGIKMRRIEEITREEAMHEKELHSQNPLYRGPVGTYYNGLSYDSILEVTTRIVGISNTYMRYHTKTEWVIMPDERYHDIIGIGIESGKVEMATSVIFRESWTTDDEEDEYTEICIPKSTSTGGLAIFKLPEDDIIDLSAYLYFNVKKKTGVGTITSLYAAGDYAHGICSNVNTTDLYNSVSVNASTGIVIGSTYDLCFAQQAAAIASFIGTW